jgi:hypothetical protein
MHPLWVILRKKRGESSLIFTVQGKFPTIGPEIIDPEL